MIHKKLVSIAVATVIGAALITAPALARVGGGTSVAVAVTSVQRTLAASVASAAPGSAAALLAGPASPVDRPSSVDQALPDRRLLVDRPLSGDRSSAIARSLLTVASHGGRSSPPDSA